MTQLIVRVCTVFALVLATASQGADVIINEIMYHPSSENVLEEYIELHNREATNVSLAGWSISSGVQFTFASNTVIHAGHYLVVAAHRQTFTNKYPTVTNVVGNWVGILSNSRNDIDLDNASGQRVDSVEYADEGDWAIRRRGLSDAGRRGWIWYREHDGLGKSLELINANLPNEHGQNWASSVATNGTPGRVNSVVSANIPPLLLEVRHFPLIPKSTEPVGITCRLLDESAGGLTVVVKHRIDVTQSFNTTPMFDDGAHGDGVAGDGLYGAILPAQPNNTVVDFFVEATDGQGNVRTWPAATLPAVDQIGSPTQSANAAYQVDDSIYTGAAPLYKIILTTTEYQDLSTIFNSAPGSDAQVNGTFISVDGTGVESHYLIGIRNRGHGSRNGNPHNYRINFRSDDPWKGAAGLNLNARTVHAQHFGSVLALKAGAAGANSRAVQIRVNNGAGPGGTPTYGHYAANEVLDSEWAARHFPFDSGGNIYKAVRDLPPAPYPDMDYRGTDSAPYKRTYLKETNVSEDDWTDIIGMLAVMALNGPVTFDDESAREVINVEQWLTHLAVMNLMGNNESGLNTGNNDDYYMYRGVVNPRFHLLYHDLDQILGGDSHPSNSDIFRATCCPISGDSLGSFAVMNRFMHWPEIEPIYYTILQRLLDTTFSAAQFDPLIDQTLESYTPTSVIASMKTWMNQRRTYVQQRINGFVPVPGTPPVATISGEPRSPTFHTAITLTIGGSNITHYRYRLNNGSYTAETPVATPLQLSGLVNGSTNRVSVIGKNSANVWQGSPTVSSAWVVNTTVPRVRINEVLARNESVLNHGGTFPDAIELYNEGPSAADLSGLQLTDDPADPGKFTFPPGTPLLAAGAYLVVYANNPDGTPGFHLGFSLDQNGEGVYLCNTAASGNAVVDSVVFGMQVADLSVGRLGNGGAWVLTQPTFGAANVVQPTGDERGLKINEWLAAAQNPFPDDFIEIANPSALPVGLGGLYLTDQPIGAPTRHRIANLSFAPAGGLVVFTADGSENLANHVNFQLASEQGEVALFSSTLSTIDCVAYGPQRSGVAVGRCSESGAKTVALVIPTPGSPNACPTAPPPPVTVSFITFSNLWKYEQSGTDLGTQWKNPGYNDAGWPAGPSLLGLLRVASPPATPPPEPIRTPLTTNSTKITFYFRSSFTVNPNLNISSLQLTHIIDDGAVFYLNGLEVARFNMNPGPVIFPQLASVTVTDATYVGPVSIPVSSISPGENLIAVEVHQGGRTNSPDIMFGLRLNGVIITNTPGQAGVVINEVLANNATMAEADGSTPDLVEFYNPSNTAVDLGGMSVSDSTLNPRRWVFNPGSILPAQGRLVLRFDADRPVSATNTGFGLGASGDKLYLFTPETNLLDFILFGLQTADFSIGRLPDGSANWQLTIPTLGAANVVAPLGDVMQLKINEWIAAPAAGDDWFEVYNPNSLPVAVGLHHLTDVLDNRTKHQIHALSFIGGTTNAWQRFVADNNVIAGADHVGFQLSATMEAIGISTPSGALIDGIGYGQQQVGVSQGRLPDGSSNVVSFPGTASPGDPNFANMTNVVVNEVLAHTDPPLEDAIELYNPGAGAVDISGWWLSDTRGNPRKYQVPPGTVLPARGYKAFYEYQFNNGDAAAAPFSLSSAKGDQVYLSPTTNNGVLTGYRASADFGPSENGVSFGRYPTSVGVDFVAMTLRTFGVDMPASVTQFRMGAGLSNAYPKVGPIVISEIMYHPSPVDTNDNVIEEFIELQNVTGGAVSLFDPEYPTNTWRLRGAVDFNFPSGRSVPAGASLLVVSFDPQTNASALAAFRNRYGTNYALVGPYSGKLDNGGETIELLKPDAPQLNGVDAGTVPYVLVEQVAYLDEHPWPANADGLGASLQRVSMTAYGNDPVNWLAAAPAPGPAGPVDTDGDGMPDDWEFANGLNRLSAADAHQDADGDGVINLNEYRSGTDPRDARSYLKVNSVVMTGGQVAIQFTAVAGNTYTLQYRDSLGAGFWGKVTDVSAQPATQTMTVFDPTASPGQRFYRLVTPAVP